MNYDFVAHRLNVEVSPEEHSFLDLRYPQIYTPLPLRLWSMIDKLSLDHTLLSHDLGKIKEGDKKGWIVGGIYFLLA